MFSDFIKSIYSSFASVPFDTLVWIILGAYAAITVLAFIACLVSAKVRAANKRPYLCLVNAFSALVLATFLLKQPLGEAALASVLFWCFGYVVYGVFCFITKPVKSKEALPSAVSFMPVQGAAMPPARHDVPVAKSSVRLEHAISVTERLLQKNLGKSDRQELEKLKSTLDTLRMKGELSPAESDILNDNFNALLKLMAKYNI